MQAAAVTPVLIRLHRQGRMRGRFTHTAGRSKSAAACIMRCNQHARPLELVAGRPSRVMPCGDALDSSSCATVSECQGSSVTHRWHALRPILVEHQCVECWLHSIHLSQRCPHGESVPQFETMQCMCAPVAVAVPALSMSRVLYACCSLTGEAL
jgi:hypothetical protein